MGYIVPFLTISSILIDVCFSNVIFIGAIFNNYNYWYLLSYSNQFTLHYPILLSITFLLIIIPLYQLFTLNDHYSGIYYYSCISLFLSSFFCNFTFFSPIFLEFFLIFSTFFSSSTINSIEVFTGFNPCYPILFSNFFSTFCQIQFMIFLFILIIYYYSLILYLIPLSFQLLTGFNLQFIPLNLFLTFKSNQR